MELSAISHKSTSYYLHSKKLSHPTSYYQCFAKLSSDPSSYHQFAKLSNPATKLSNPISSIPKLSIPNQSITSYYQLVFYATSRRKSTTTNHQLIGLFCHADTFPNRGTTHIHWSNSSNLKSSSTSSLLLSRSFTPILYLTSTKQSIYPTANLCSSIPTSNPISIASLATYVAICATSTSATHHPPFSCQSHVQSLLAHTSKPSIFHCPI